MTYTTHSLVQGTQEWAAHRSNSNNASELAVVLGISPQMQRNEYIRLRATGSEKEFSDWVIENILADGHRFEHLARPLAEKIIGDELYPMTVSIAADGLKRRLSASLDGAVASDSVNWEHKRLNAELREALARGVVPEQYHPQMEQGQMINGATRTLFMASEWNDNDELIEEMHVWYESNPALRAKIIPAWRQAEADADAYVPAEVIPAAVAAPIRDLPAVTYKLNGTALTSNLAEYKVRALELVEDSKRPMETDQDFADRIELCKKFGEAEKKIELMQAQVVGEIHDVNAFCTDLGEISKMFKAARIAGEKLVEAEKANRKNKILAGAKEKWQEHVASLNKRLGKPYMPEIPADFALAIKGLKSMSSMQNAVDTLLANAKLAANEACDKIDANLKTLRELAADHAFLFADTPQLVGKDNDDLIAIIKSRIAEHVEKNRKEEEANRERIAKQERERADREAADRNAAALEEIAGINQQVVIAQIGRAGVRKGGTLECLKETLAETEAWQIDAERFGALVGAAQQAKDKAIAEIRALIEAKAKADAEAADKAKQQTDQATVSPNGASSTPGLSTFLPADAVAPESAPSADSPSATVAASVTAMAQARQEIADGDDDGTMLTLGEINAQLGFTVTAEFLSSLGFAFIPAPKGNGKLYRNCDLRWICDAIAAHCLRVGGFTKKAA